MVTAVLPSLTDDSEPALETIPKPFATPRTSLALSVDSQVTITPESFRNSSVSPSATSSDDNGLGQGRKPAALAGYVGVFTGCGALVALTVFLPLPSRFSSIEGVTLAQAVQYSFYVVGTISLLVAVFVFFGLRGLKGEEGKGLRMLFGYRGTAPDGSASEYPTAPKNVSLATVTSATPS
jgi:hypothetical protein